MTGLSTLNFSVNKSGTTWNCKATPLQRGHETYYQVEITAPSLQSETVEMYYNPDSGSFRILTSILSTNHKEIEDLISREIENSEL